MVKRMVPLPQKKRRSDHWDRTGEKMLVRAAACYLAGVTPGQTGGRDAAGTALQAFWQAVLVEPAAQAFSAAETKAAVAASCCAWVVRLEICVANDCCAAVNEFNCACWVADRGVPEATCASNCVMVF